MGKPRLVVLSQWPAILCLIATGVVLIPLFGPAGALLADGIAKTLTGALLLIFVLRDLPRHYPKELLIFTVRFLLALVLAALPGILILFWHPPDRILQAVVLGISGVVFLLLCFWLLTWFKPLNSTDVTMIEGVNPKIARYLHWFVRG